MKLLKHNGNIALFGGGQFTIPDLSIIELEVSGDKFVGSQGASTTFQFTSSEVDNNMHIDFNDGTGWHIFPPNTTNRLSHSYIGVNGDFYTYQDGYSGRRVVKIKFDKPEKIVGCSFTAFNMYGKFPKAFSNYNFTTSFSVTNTSANSVRWDEMPPDFRSLNTKSLRLNKTFNTVQQNLPPWLYSSVNMETLILRDVFDLSADSSINNIDKLINMPTINHLSLNESSLNSNSIPENLKNFPNLRILHLGGNNTLTVIPSALRDCANIETLLFGNVSWGLGYSSLTNWGDGLGGMINLKTLEIVGNSNAPTTVVTGLENCTNLKKLSLQGAYNTIVRIDEFVNNFYNFTVTNNPFTGFTLEVGWRTSAARNSRPTGVYQQPIDYIDDSNFGTPATPMEQIWVLVNVFGHTISITNIAGNGSEILTP